MEFSKVRVCKNTRSDCNISSDNNDSLDMDLDWGDMIAPPKRGRIFTTSTNPYVINPTEYSPLNEDTVVEIEPIELLDSEQMETLDDLEILRSSSLAARDLKFRIVSNLGAK